MVRLGLWGVGTQMIEVQCRSHYIISRVHTINMTLLMKQTLITCWSSGSVCQVFCCAVSSCSSLAFNSFLPSAAAAKSLQSCPALCDPIDGSQPGSPVPGILQARTLEWVAISFSNALKWKVKVKSLSRVRLFETPWTAAYQAPPSMGFSRQEYWSGVPLPSPMETSH